MKWGIRVGAATAVLAAAACGGGGNENSGGNIPVVGGVATPPPAPSPSSTPTPTYEQAIDYSRYRLFNGIGGTVEATTTTGDLTVTSSLSATDNGIIVTYSPEASSVMLVYGGQGATYEPVRAFQTGFIFNQALTNTQPRVDFEMGPVALFYVAAVRETVQSRTFVDFRQIDRERQRRILIGAPTLASDLPTGPRTYSGNLDLAGRIAFPAPTFTFEAESRTNFRATQARLVVDLASGTVQSTILAVQTSVSTGTTPARATLVLAGAITPRNLITGTFISPDSGYVGRFVGQLYGPQGAEIGIVIELTRADGTRQIGYFTGTR